MVTEEVWPSTESYLDKYELLSNHFKYKSLGLDEKLIYDFTEDPKWAIAREYVIDCNVARKRNALAIITLSSVKFVRMIYQQLDVELFPVQFREYAYVAYKDSGCWKWSMVDAILSSWGSNQSVKELLLCNKFGLALHDPGFGWIDNTIMGEQNLETLQNKHKLAGLKEMERKELFLYAKLLGIQTAIFYSKKDLVDLINA